MERNRTEFEQARRKRARKRLLRRLGVLAAMGVVILVALVAREFLYQADLTTRLRDFFASLQSGPGYPVEAQLGEQVDLYPFGKDLAVVTESALSVYNDTAKENFTVRHGYKNPICVTNGNRILTFDRGGKQLRVDSHSKALWSLELEDGQIFSASMAQNGALGVVTSSSQYQREVAVYDSHFRAIWRWYTENLATDLALSDDGQQLAVSSVNAENGQLVSQVILLKTDDDQPEATITFQDQLVVGLSFNSKGQVAVLTDRQAALYNQRGEELQRVDFGGGKLRNFHLSQGDFIFVLDDHGDNTQLTLYSLRDGMEVQNAVPLEQGASQLTVGADGIYLLGERAIYAFSLDLDQSAVMERQDCRCLAAVEGSLYGATTSQLIRLPTLSQQLLQDVEDRQAQSDAASSDAPSQEESSSQEGEEAPEEEPSQAPSESGETASGDQEDSSSPPGEEEPSSQEEDSQYQPIIEDRP